MRKLWVIALALLVGGCAQMRAKLDAADDAQCRSYGAEYGSNAYVYCRQSIADQRIQASQQAFANMTTTGLAIAATATPPSPQPSPPANHVCVSPTDNSYFYRC